MPYAILFMLLVFGTGLGLFFRFYIIIFGKHVFLVFTVFCVFANCLTFVFFLLAGWLAGWVFWWVVLDGSSFFIIWGV